MQTNNSFGRVNFLDKAWAFLPMGKEEMPLMFACDTGYGDGTYDVVCDYCGAVPCGLSIAFLEEPAP